jgi:hypothetical protein
MSFEKLVPVIRITDMSEDMQKEVIEVARVAIDRSSTVGRYVRHTLRTSKSRRISRTIFGRITTAPGIASSDATSDRLLHTRPSTTSTSTSDR